MEEWKQTSMVSSDVIIEGCELTMDWYSHPEWNFSTEGILCKCLDSHHLLTNLRTKTSTTGLDNISPDAWKRVAHTYRTKLTPSMVDDLIDKQSNSNAQTHFSEEVENVMVEHGDMNEASFCRLIRQWYEAEDAPSLGVIDRINRWLTLKEYLLQGVNFASFPPQSQYIKRLSLIAFEGFLTGIDTKIQLYSMCGSYCVRTASSLPAETCVGGIQDMNFNNSVSVKAKDVPKIMSSLTEIMTIKCNPNRGFYMRTSRAPVYPIVEGIQLDNPDSDAANGSMPIRPRNHFFDRAERKRTKPHRKPGTVNTDLDGPRKGTQPMRREFFRCDESKINPLKKSGLPVTI